MADGQSLQAASFAPGSEAELVVERGGDGLATVAVWDAGQLRRAGRLDGYEAEFVIAAAEHGLPHRALIVEELAASPDLRRTGIPLLVYSEWFVPLDTRGVAATGAGRPPPSARGHDSRTVVGAALVGQRRGKWPRVVGRPPAVGRGPR